MPINSTKDYENSLVYTILKSIIIKILDLNYSPNKLYNFVFNVINDHINKNETKKILYASNSYGFLLSDCFYHFIDIYYPQLKNHSVSNIIRDRYDIIETFASINNLSISDALNIISYEYASIQVCEIPKHRSFTIINHNNLEYIKLQGFSY